MNSIIATSPQTISDSIEEGQFIINGNHRIFAITLLTDDEVTLTPHNTDPGKEGRILKLPRETFCKLYALRNYSQVSSAENGSTEHIQAEITGANRFMVK